jgi:hypothetical protein|nr:hypothetical protein [Neorhizobium tomejilense]
MTAADDQPRAKLVASLEDFAARYRQLPEDAESDYWFYEKEDMPANDFNRSLEPVGSEGFAKGSVRIMCDGDFYAVAQLPIEYEVLSAKDIADILWPGFENAIFRPDSGDYWWTAIADENLEVPGQPHELWFHVLRNGLIEESLRYNAYETREAAEANGARVRASVSEGDTPMWQVRTWRDGIRIDEGLNHLRSRMQAPITNAVAVD